MSIASDYVSQWFSQYSDALTIGATLIITQQSAARGSAGVAGYAFSVESQPIHGPAPVNQPAPIVGMQFRSCALYFSDRHASGSQLPFSGSPDTVDVSVGLANRWGFIDGLVRLAIANETWGGTVDLTTTDLDATTQQLIFQGPGIGNVGFGAMYIVSFYPDPIP